jgi:hypothetical protein
MRWTGMGKAKIFRRFSRILEIIKVGDSFPGYRQEIVRFEGALS